MTVQPQSSGDQQGPPRLDARWVVIAAVVGLVIYLAFINPVLGAAIGVGAVVVGLLYAVLS